LEKRWVRKWVENTPSDELVLDLEQSLTILETRTYTRKNIQGKKTLMEVSVLYVAKGYMPILVVKNHWL
jgi:hypothetical protein